MNSRRENTEIVFMEIIPMSLQLTEPFSIATGQQQGVLNVLILLRLANGITGLGEAAPFPAVSGETQESAAAVLRSVKEKIIGRDIREWENISFALEPLFTGQHAALCGLQMALTDAMAKHRGVSVGALFGGASDTLTTDMTIVTSDDLNHAGVSARAIRQRGIHTIKLKTSGKDILLDFARIKKVKEAAPDALLTIDGNCGYTSEGAMQLIDLLKKENIPLLFFEQPLPREQWNEMAELARMTNMKFAADESARSTEDVRRLIEDGSAQVINIKLMKSGLFEAIGMIKMAKEAGLELMIGGMVETILSMSFSAHVAAGIGGFKYADLDTPLFITEHPFKGGFDLKGDCIKIDLNTPGHGVTLGDAFIA